MSLNRDSLSLPPLTLSVDEEDFSIRLVGGSREGILEVALNGRWGTICEDEEWDRDNAMVACQELGILTTEDGYSITPITRYVLVLILSILHIAMRNWSSAIHVHVPLAITVHSQLLLYLQLQSVYE